MIFYFSGTGNTRWAAQLMSSATEEPLLCIADEMAVGNCHYTLGQHERIGFCFPVHGWQPPHIVRSFLSRLNLQSPLGSLGQHYTYILCTCGDSTGLAVDMLSKQLMAKGISVDSSLSLIMPESYVCLPFMYTDTPEREQQKKRQAAIDVNDFVTVVQQRQQGYSRLQKGFTPWTFSHVIGAYFNRYMITDSKFTVDADTCIHCGRCAKVCPVGNIEFSGTPEWKGNGSCTCCLSCYHHCPVHAINYGRITRHRGQYYYKP
mgnify:CR=1 FL=1